jgi:hypothetical protein
MFAATSADVRRLACVHSLTCHVAEHAAAERLSPSATLRALYSQSSTYLHLTAVPAALTSSGAATAFCQIDL